MSKLVLTISLFLFAASVCLGQPLSSASRKKLDNDIRYLVSQHRGYGDFSVAVVDEQGTVSQVSGQTPFPLASVFKLPLLLAILKGQEKGTFPGPSSLLTVTTSDQCIGSGRLSKSGLGATVSVDKACRLMMSISDNTATDLLFRRFGTSKLDPWLHGQGYKSSKILLTNRQAWLLSLGRVPGWGKTSPETRVAKWEKLNRDGQLKLALGIERYAANLSLRKFQAIENASTGTQSGAQDKMLAARLDNKMSALDLAKLLMALDQGNLLSDKKRSQALSILAGQRYHTRLPSKLSPSTDIYHKTGTLSGVRDDAGLLYMKNRNDGVAVVFLSQNLAPGASKKADNLAARIAKLVEKAYLNG